MKKLYVNVRYLIVPVMTVTTIIGLLIGGIYAWIGVFLFGINTILDTLTKDIHLRADFDEDGVPDILDSDDDGDGISDPYDIHCPLDPTECSLYPDEDYLRSVELNIEDGILQVHDTVSFSKYDSSALRNLTSTLLIDDRRITPEELTWMTGAMCDNIVSRDVVESWRVLLSLEGQN